MRHHADHADEHEGERRIVRPSRRNPDAQGDRTDDVERAQDGGGDPPERHEMDDPEHASVVEEARYASRVGRDREAGQRQRDMRDAEVQNRKQTRRQLGARWRRTGHVSEDRLSAPREGERGGKMPSPP